MTRSIRSALDQQPKTRRTFVFVSFGVMILGFNMLQPFFGKQMVSIEVSTIFQSFFGRIGPILCFFWGINWVQITRCSGSPPTSVRRRFPRNVVPKGIATKNPEETMALWHYGQRRSTQPAMAKKSGCISSKMPHDTM